VVLLGWAGCQQRHLDKYADMYGRLGYDAVCCTDHCSLRRLCCPGTLSRLAAALLQRLEEERPAAVHVFSNGGAFLWSRTLALAAQRPDNSEPLVACQVLDSTPGRFDQMDDPRRGYHFLSELAGGVAALRLAVAAIYPLIALLFLLLHLVTLQARANLPLCAVPGRRLTWLLLSAGCLRSGSRAVVR